MSTAKPLAGRASSPAPGALLLCRANRAFVTPVVQLLGEPMMLTQAGPEWTVLVPEGRPWLHGGEPSDRLCVAAHAQPGAEQIEWPGRRDVLRTQSGIVENTRLGSRLPWTDGRAAGRRPWPSPSWRPACRSRPGAYGAAVRGD